MTKTTSLGNRPQSAWFAPRQVYLRTGEGSAYVELSTPLQVGVALGFGVLALWLMGASYGAVSAVFEDDLSAEIASQLAITEERLVAANEDAERVRTLELELADARAAIAKAQQVDETAALSAELSQTKSRLHDVRQQLSEAKAQQATLEAKIEAQAAAGEGSQPAEEASSLHVQLEEAFAEIEDLEESRDEAEAKVAALTAENAAMGEGAERNETLLEAATLEIERLQTKLAGATKVSGDRQSEHEQRLNQLTTALAGEQSAKEALQQQVDTLTGELERQAANIAATGDLKTAQDAEAHARAIAAELTEAELLATIDRLEAELDTRQEKVNGSAEVDALKAKLAVAEAEIETILMNTLNDSAARGEEVAEAQTFAAALPIQDNSEEVKRLERELSTARSDIIKLRSDVRAAKERLAEQAETQTAAEQKPDNSAKLEQQLASTRSRIQQLNKALADAKLREVAVDLALISVVPTPSPPAPR